ncbi:phosphatase PAP2 family protein [Streptomyces sp. NPDC002838]|uniref:phosphatase PAP2 family protein n=1 Tax=Streptomyces sp. NPDC002838 TaxID=3154436 RepID=UPI00332C0A75
MEDWAEIRRLHGPIRCRSGAIARHLGISKNTVKRAPATDRPPKYERTPKCSVADAVVRVLDPKEVVALPFVALVAVLAAGQPSAVAHPDSRAALALSAGLIAVWCGAAMCFPVWHSLRPHWGRRVRDVIAVVLCLAVYPSLRWAVPMVHPGNYDPVLAAADRWLFGGRDPLPVIDSLVSPAVTAVLGFAYSCEWVPILALSVILCARRRDREWSDLLLGLVLVQSAGYVGYFLVPAVGPWYGLADRFTVPLGDSFWIRSYLEHSISVDAFPSLHVATIILVGCFAWRDCRTFYWLISPLLVAIPVSTLYLRWHYVTDVIAGLAVGVIGRLLAPRINAAWGVARQEGDYRRSGVR